MENLDKGLEIIRLPKAEWEGTVIPMRYTTEEYFDVKIERNETGYSVEVSRQQFDTPVSHYPEEYDFPDKLYQPHW
ncbi:MAG: GNAT family N-acetyltransferase, partial [Lachnospiraceae bacterium]|nr:GNAT family N-acetyltransferase [Lachnospiraceae bacterium]